MDREDTQYIYLDQLDKGDKIYKWKLKNFLIATVPLVLAVWSKSLIILGIVILWMGTILLLTFEFRTEEHFLNMMKVRIIFLMKNKQLTNNQSLSMKRLKEINDLMNFDSIEQKWIVINKNKKGFFFEYAQHNLDLMDKMDIDSVIHNNATFVSNFDSFSYQVLSLSQNFRSQIEYNEGLQNPNPKISELQRQRLEYLKYLESTETDEEKKSYLYLESSEENAVLFINSILDFAESNNIGLTLVKGDYLKIVMANLIGDIKSLDALPLNHIESVGKQRGVEDV